MEKPGTDLLPRAILDNLFDGVYFVDLERRITYWNRGAEQITGYAAQEVLGRRCSENILMHVDQSGTQLCLAGCPLHATMADGENRQTEVYLHHRDGHRVPVQVRVSPVRDESGRIVGGIEVFTDVSRQAMMQMQLEEMSRLAMLDSLTGLANRRHLDQQLASRHEEWVRYGWTYGLVLFDLDRFKSINDSYGHPIGDRVLSVVARTLSHNIRSFDLAGRWGGEEFLVIFRHVSPEFLRRKAEALRILISRSRVITDSGEVLRFSVSGGVAWSGEGEDTETLIRRADEGLYLSKSQGRNRISVAPRNP